MQINHALQTTQRHCADNDMSVWTDEVLIHLITSNQGRAGDAFSILALRHQQWIYRRCQFRLGNQHDAEDATQDIIMRVHARLHQCRQPAQFKAWLSTIINNYCNTFAVRRARYVTSDHLQKLIELHELEKSPASAKSFFADPESRLAEQDIMHKALTSLTEKNQQVLKLRFYADKSLQEISDILCLTLSATKARLYRAIEQLKQLYFRLDDFEAIRIT